MKMNDGKICVSVCAKNIDQLTKRIKRAAQIADVIELRLDCLDDLYLEDFSSRLIILKLRKLQASLDKPFLLTNRIKEEGGRVQPHLLQINPEAFWANDKVDFRGFAELIDCELRTLIDLEYNPRFYHNISGSRLICSFHHWKTDGPELPDLQKVYRQSRDVLIFGDPENGNSRHPDIIKIAVYASDITDSLVVWKLLEKARADQAKLIPIAMGEAGKWTRILGPAFGVPLVYAAPEENLTTAPGQISARDLIEVYRVRELDRQTEIYGVIGRPVGHSLSPYIHNAAFRHHRLNAVYIPFEVTDLAGFINRMVRPETREIDWNLRGFSVTIPHKESIIKYLDYIDQVAEKIGAVNTVKIVDGKLHGFNTDAAGFIAPLQSFYGDLKDARVGIIGSGGAARACIYALEQAGAEIFLFSRNRIKADELSGEFDIRIGGPLPTTHEKLPALDIIVNATPLGTIGELADQTPLLAGQIKNLQLVYDLVYNPFETLFLRQARMADIPAIGGLAMLAAQAIKQFELWTGLPGPLKQMSRAALTRLK